MDESSFIVGLILTFLVLFLSALKLAEMRRHSRIYSIYVSESMKIPEVKEFLEKEKRPSVSVKVLDDNVVRVDWMNWKGIVIVSVVIDKNTLVPIKVWRREL